MANAFLEARRASFQNVEVLEGGEAFEGLQSIEVVVELEGGDAVYTNRRKAVGMTEGRAKISGSMKLLLSEGTAYLKRFPRFFWDLHTITLATVTDKFQQTLIVKNLRFTKFNYSSEGTDAVVIEFPFVALDVTIDGLSIIPEENELTQ